MQIEAIEYMTKGKSLVSFDQEAPLILYYTEIKSYDLKEGSEVSEEKYQCLLHQIIGKRATKRAMHLLEKGDKTEYQLRDKLKRNQYPEEAIEDAISYVKNYHYIDDLRYARNYIEYHQKEKSRQRLKTDLMRKGIKKEWIEQALEEMFLKDETEQIAKWLEKKKFDEKKEDPKEYRRIYQFLLRKGFRNTDIQHVIRMKQGY